MAVIKAVNSRSSIGTIVNYVTKKEKTEEKLMSGIDCNPTNAIDEMKATKEIWHKTNGRQYAHFVQSFSPDEKITLEEAHKIAYELAQKEFNGYEVLIATHKDTDHIHSHIIVNTVNHEDGHKLHRSAHDLALMKDHSDELCKERGLSIAHKNEEITDYDIGKHKVLEKAIKGQKYKSYVFDCYKSATVASKTAVSREDFIERMRVAGWETTWTDRKYITFADMDGNKVRNSNLEKTFKEPFGKEDLQHGFEINHERANAHRVIAEKRGLISDTGIDHQTGGSQENDTNLAISELEATIGQSKDAVSSDDRAKSDRIANEQSRQRERDRLEKQRTVEESHRSQGFSR